MKRKNRKQSEENIAEWLKKQKEKYNMKKQKTKTVDDYIILTKIFLIEQKK